jgi:hypothetical protein
VTLAPAQRADLLLDMTGKPGDRMRVVDDFYEDLAYQLVELAYDDSSPVREQPLKTLARLPGPQLPEPQLEHAVRHQVTLSGGMMGMMMGAMVHGRMMDMRSMMRQGMVWAINNMAAQGHVMDPIFSLKRNQTCLIRWPTRPPGITRCTCTVTSFECSPETANLLGTGNGRTQFS